MQVSNELLTFLSSVYKLTGQVTFDKAVLEAKYGQTAMAEALDTRLLTWSLNGTVSLAHAVPGTVLHKLNFTKADLLAVAYPPDKSTD